MRRGIPERNAIGCRPYRVIKFVNSVTPEPSYGDIHFLEPDTTGVISLGLAERHYIFDLKDYDSLDYWDDRDVFDVLEGFQRKFQFLLASMCGAYQGMGNFSIICDILEEHLPGFNRSRLSYPVKSKYYDDEGVEFLDAELSPFGYVEYRSANVCQDALLALSSTGCWQDGVWEFLTNENILVVGSAYSIMGRDDWRQFEAYLPENSFEYLA